MLQSSFSLSDALNRPWNFGDLFYIAPIQLKFCNRIAYETENFFYQAKFLKVWKKQNISLMNSLGLSKRWLRRDFSFRSLLMHYVFHKMAQNDYAQMFCCCYLFI